MFEFLQKQGASVELAELLVEMADSVKMISEAIVRTDTGKVGTKNSFGEEQAAMDVQSEEIMSDHLRSCPFVSAYGSEELDTLETANEGGKFSVYYDPLDGSSLLDVNFSVGTIVGIYEGADVMGRTARDQVAALYGLYGPHVTLMVTVGNGVHEFVLKGGVWELETEQVKLNDKKNYFAPGNLRATKEREDYFELVQSFMKEQYTLRYSGGMVPDINHILKKGSGVFMYPGMPSAPDGKLRLLYECGPMAFLMEQAGGAASAGDMDVLDVEIKSLVQRTPIYIGSKKEVEKVASALGR